MEKIEKRIAGWREWLALPDLGVAEIKAKLDTGARTSALHAFDVEHFVQNGAAWVKFAVHPVQGNETISQICTAAIVDKRSVTNSGGGTEKRLFIETTVRLGGETWPIEISLTNRDEMGFRMLLGRTAMKNMIVVDPSRSFLLGKHKAKARTKKGKSK